MLAGGGAVDVPGGVVAHHAIVDRDEVAAVGDVIGAEGRWQDYVAALGAAGVGPVSVAWVREVLGEAFVTTVIKKGRDITTVAHLGRHIPAHLRTAMIVGGRECDVVGCHARGYLELDHSEVDYADGGPAAWWNIDWTCAADHRKKTRGWKLGPRDPLTAKRTLTPPDARSRPTATTRR